MTFGKPRLGDTEVFCLSCGDRYPEYDILLKYAGRTEDGDFWNDKCPNCGAHNAHIDVDGRSDAELRAKQHEIARIRREAIKQQQDGNGTVEL